MNEKYKSQYHIVSQKEENEIEGIINGKYENVVLELLTQIIFLFIKNNSYEL